MWLEKVKENLDKGRYTQREMFKRDILLIFENARIYNAKDTIFYKFADILQAQAQPMLDKLKETEIDAENRKKRQIQQQQQQSNQNKN